MTVTRANDTIEIQAGASIPFTFTIKEWNSTTRAWAAKDISSCTTKTVDLVKPGGQRITKTLSFSTDGKDGKVTCTPTAAELGMPGDGWEVQVYLAGTGWSTRTAIVRMNVLRNA